MSKRSYKYDGALEPRATRRKRLVDPGQVLSNLLRWNYTMGWTDLATLRQNHRRLQRFFYCELEFAATHSRHRGGFRCHVRWHQGRFEVALSDHLRTNRDGRGPRDDSPDTSSDADDGSSGGDAQAAASSYPECVTNERDGQARAATTSKPVITASSPSPVSPDRHRDRKGQGPTVFSLGKKGIAFSGLRRQRIVLASRDDVEREDFYREFDIGLLVTCTGSATRPFRLPRSIVQQLTRMTFVVTHPELRQKSLGSIRDAVFDCWRAGKDAVFHCNQSFHRGPVGTCALAKTICGIAPREFFKRLSRKRKIWPGYYTDGEERYLSYQGQTLKEAVRWIEGLRVTRWPADLEDAVDTIVPQIPTSSGAAAPSAKPAPKPMPRRPRRSF